MNSRFPLGAADIVALALALYRRDFKRNLGLLRQRWSTLFRSSKHSLGYLQAITVFTLQELEGQEPEKSQIGTILDRWQEQLLLLQDTMERVLRPALFVIYPLLFVFGLTFAPLFSELADLLFELETFWLGVRSFFACVFVGVLVITIPFLLWMQQITLILPAVVFFEEQETPGAVLQRCRQLTQGHGRRLWGITLFTSLVTLPLWILWSSPLLIYLTLFWTSQLTPSSVFVICLLMLASAVINNLLLPPFGQILQAIAYREMRVLSGIDLELSDSRTYPS